MYFEKKQLAAHLRCYTCKAETAPMFLSLMFRADLEKTASNTLNSGSPLPMNGQFPKLEAFGIRFALLDKSLPSGKRVVLETCCLGKSVRSLRKDQGSQLLFEGRIHSGSCGRKAQQEGMRTLATLCLTARKQSYTGWNSPGSLFYLWPTKHRLPS